MIEIWLLFRQISPWIARYRTVLAVAITSFLAIALTTSLLPLIFKQLLDSMVISKNEAEGFPLVLLTLVGMVIILGLANLVSSYAINWISGKIGTDLCVALFEKLVVLPVSCFHKPGQDKVNTCFFLNIDQAINGIAQLFTTLGKETSIVAGLLMVMLYINWEFSLMGFLIMLVIGTIMQFISLSGELHQNKFSRLIDPNLLSLTSSEHIKTIKLDGSQTQESQHFRHSIEHRRSSTFKQTIIRTFSKIIALICITAILTAFFIFFIQQLSLGKITIGDAGALIMAALMLVLPARRVLSITSHTLHLQNKFQVMHDIDSLLAQHNESNSGSVEISRASGQIRFEGVSACNYSLTCPPLFNLTLTIQPGEIVALANTEGQERTLIDLIARFIRPTNGTISLDGIDIATIKLADLRTNIAWLTPDMKLLNDTIATNIAYGTMRCATEVHIMKIARTCHVTKFAREMSHGLQTRIGLNGVELTENQRQCIILARALLKNPSVVIIDETTAMFDIACPSVNDALDILIKNRTTLVLSSQPAMIGRAHRIIKI